MVIKSGSANAAHLRELTVPDAKWVGVWATDIEKCAQINELQCIVCGSPAGM